MAETPIRLGYFVSHPIQYQAPLLRLLAQQPDVELKVFYCSAETAGNYFDPGFNRAVAWDVPLLDGYSYEVLPSLGHSRAFNFWRPFNYGLTKRFRRAKLDVLWVHGYSDWRSLSAIAVARLLGIKVLVRGESTLNSVVERAGRSIYLSVLNQLVDGFLAIGTENRAFYRHYGINDNKIFLVPYAVDNCSFETRASRAGIAREQLRNDLGLSPQLPVVLYAGKLTERKRPMDLLRAFSQYLSSPGNRPAYLLFIGEGEMRSQLSAEIEALGLGSSIRILGFRNQTELPAYYDLCDLFVLPSVREPWGLVVNEVMNASRAVLASDQVGCAADLVEDGVNGFVFKAGDIPSLCAALSKALSPHVSLASMGQASRKRIRQWGFAQDIEGLRSALQTILFQGTRV